MVRTGRRLTWRGAGESPLQPHRGERAYEPVLRGEHDSIEAPERSLDAPSGTRRSSLRLSTNLPVELGHVEVDGEDEGEREKRGKREPRLSGDVTERDEERRVHDEIGLGIEVPAGEGHFPGGPGELTIGVVEQRLHLQQERGRHELAEDERHGGENPGRRVGQDDGRGRYPGSKEEQHEETSQWAKHELEDKLSSGASLVLAGKRGGGRALCGSGHPVRSMVDTAAVAIADWSEVDGALERTFQFENFVAALAFVNRVGDLAEAENHHPDIAIHYNRVTLRWWTHTAGGITDRDRDLAEKTGALG